MNSNMLYNRQKEIGDEAFITIKTDLKGHIAYANSYFLNIVNAKNSDLIGKNHNIVRHPDIESTVAKPRYRWAKPLNWSDKQSSAIFKNIDNIISEKN